MDKQRIIIGCSGSFNEGLVSELVKLLGGKGLQVQHASHFYDGTGQTHFAVGTGADLAAEMAGLGQQITVVENAAVGRAGNGSDQTAAEKPFLLTIGEQLEQIQETLNAQGLMIASLKKEKAAVAPKAPKGGAKKEGADDNAQVVNPSEAPKLQTPPQPLRDIDTNGCCTRCGVMFEEAVEGDDHLNGPMCEHKQAAPPSDPPPTEHQETTDNNDGTQPPAESKED